MDTMRIHTAGLIMVDTQEELIEYSEAFYTAMIGIIINDICQMEFPNKPPTS